VTPTTFRVNSVLDTVAANLKTGKDASGHISLRSAIQAADAHPGTDTIVVPAGTFLLTIPGTDENASATGDLDINGSVKIKGAGAGSTIVDGNQLDRVFKVLSGKVSISGLTIQGGLVRGDVGGGLLNSGGQVTLTGVTVTNNESEGVSGVVGVTGAQGGAGGPGGTSTVGEGGGIFNAAGSLTLIDCTVASNRAVGGAGGAGGQGGTGDGGNGVGPGVDGQNGTGGAGGVGGQGSVGEGGGLFNAPGASLTITGTSITSNAATGGAGGSGQDGT
jgi:hypothetical protein